MQIHSEGSPMLFHAAYSQESALSIAASDSAWKAAK